MMKKILLLMLILLMAFSGIGAVAESAVESSPAVTPDVDASEDADEWLFEEDEDWAWDNDEIWDDEFVDEGNWDVVEDQFLDEEDTVEDTLLSAMEVYSWFVMQPLDVDPDKADESGELFMVLDERFNTMASLREYVSNYFSSEIVDELFKMNVYTEIGGYLYCSGEGRNMDENIGETEFAVTEETENKVVYTVSVNYWFDEENAKEEQFTYVREKQGDGVWRFTQFPFFW